MNKSVSHLEKEQVVNCLESPLDFQINTVTQATKSTPEKPKPTCHHYKKPGNYCNQSRQLKREKERTVRTNNGASRNNSCRTNYNPINNKNAIISNNSNTNN